MNDNRINRDNKMISANEKNVDINEIQKAFNKYLNSDEQIIFNSKVDRFDATIQTPFEIIEEFNKSKISALEIAGPAGNPNNKVQKTYLQDNDIKKLDGIIEKYNQDPDVDCDYCRKVLKNLMPEEKAAHERIMPEEKAAHERKSLSEYLSELSKISGFGGIKSNMIIAEIDKINDKKEKDIFLNYVKSENFNGYVKSENFNGNLNIKDILEIQKNEIDSDLSSLEDDFKKVNDVSLKINEEEIKKRHGLPTLVDSAFENKKNELEEHKAIIQRCEDRILNSRENTHSMSNGR